MTRDLALGLAFALAMFAWAEATVTLVGRILA